MTQPWRAEDFDQCFRQETVGFEDGFAHAERQGIPRFIEEYRISRVKDAIARWIVEEPGAWSLGHGGADQWTDDGRLRTEGREHRTSNIEHRTSNEEQNLTGHRPPTTDHRPLILDLGCGNGWYPIRLKEKWKCPGEIIGIDVSPYNIELFNREIQQRDLSGLKAMVGNAEELSFDDNSFDVVYATETLEHVADPVQVFSEVFRVLKPNGEFILTTPSGPLHRFWNTVFFIPKLIKRCFVKPREGSRIYDCPMSYLELRNIFKKTGFELINYHKAVFLPHESYIKFFPRPFQYLMLLKAKFMEFLGPLTRFWGLHHIIRLRKKSV